MLRSDELDGLRTDALAALTDSCDVMRAARVSDDAGGVTETWASEGTVACRLVPARSAREDVAGGAVASITRWAVLFAHDADVMASDRLEIGGVTYEVVGVGVGSESAVMRADVVRII